MDVSMICLQFTLLRDFADALDGGRVPAEGVLQDPELRVPEVRVWSADDSRRGEHGPAGHVHCIHQKYVDI